jgi:oxygen-independent coproporphyrinogen-3 oxidase
VTLTPELVAKYATTGPRYTSYPPATQFAPLDVDAVRARWRDARSDLSLYAHIPYCRVRCLFCGCHTRITHNDGLGAPYVDALLSELDALARVTDLGRPLRQLALGGGTPNFLPADEMRRFVQGLDARLAVTTDAERSIECDPRTVTPDYLRMLRELGFNRFSFGLQDTDPTVMAAVNRDQSAATVEAVVSAAREGGDVPINLDLIYGLPRQTEATWGNTLAHVLALRPTRLAVYGYAHVPWMKRHQKGLEQHDLPSDALRATLQETARSTLINAGYVEIGFDHYALPTDELAVAYANGTLHRNFMGYTTRRGLDLVALGTSGISDTNGTYVQNTKDVDGWERSANAGDVTWERGFVLSDEDRLRREVILDLSCNLGVDLGRYVTDAERHFEAELARLAPMVDDGLLDRDGAELRLTPLGRRFVRHAAMAFDQYLPAETGRMFSRTS